jgi:hypothetical protein
MCIGLCIYYAILYKGLEHLHDFSKISYLKKKIYLINLVKQNYLSGLKYAAEKMIADI